ncbi:ComEA family DNA-binding protein [Simiduia aestuariiviva]|uniref:DNA uptake protein ComE-like DNA-binding protein n=1 Tax=Simiduia aestuariiviva TaxID=1510459 RepID=A0A839UNJ7_9GAMM|nr:helix-hairpin-helix domain-containing protein [Simiduia aestuariiviva]MBB3169412.1 DNA uptake protein ComE-like DNA-binding protein [Simiduia aestuariiviva]
MTFLITLLLALIAFLLTRLQFLLTAQRDDLADLRQQIASLRSSDHPSTPTSPVAGRESINSISKNGLLKIPGVGAACAQRVIDARPYASMDELDAVSGLTQTQRDHLKQHLLV